MRARCNWPGCTGVVDEADGLCDKGWHDQSRSPDVAGVGQIDHIIVRPGPDDLVDQGDTDHVAHPFGRSRVGAGVVYVPPAPPVDPYIVVQTEPDIPQRLICTDCSRTVQPGDGADDTGSGQCACGARYDFAPKLQPGELVDREHYRIVGVLDRGGQGWIHFAEDLKLNEMPCVLKARRHTEDRAGREAEKKELDALAALSHPGIVKIFNLVEHPDQAGRVHRYLVMEYVAGRSLEHRRRQRGVGRLKVTEALAFLHAVMPALGHLHEHGLVYCDLKPENILHAGDAVTLIDLGAAQRMNGKAGTSIATRGFRAPELRVTGRPTVASDIYSAGRTLAVLVCGSWKRWWEDESEYELPPRNHRNLQGHDCLWRLLQRACAKEPEDRFVDAEEMAEALHGVMCQVATEVEGTAKPYDSQRWGPPRSQLGPLDWRSLPVPILPEQLSRPNRFSSVGGADPEATIRVAAALPDLSWVDSAVLVRAYCEVEDLPAAAQAAGRIDPSADDSAGQPGRRRTTSIVEAAQQYLIGVVALARGTLPDAVDHLERAYSIAPGEPACALALGACLEAGGEHDWLVQADGLYEQVAATDPSWVAATAGRARVLQALGRFEEAALVLAAVPEVHPLRHEALTMACRAVPSGKYYPAVAEAAHALLPADDQDSWTGREAELAAAFSMMSLAALSEDPGTQIVGRLTSPDDLAAEADRALRRRAAFASTVADRHLLLDEAAHIRPWRTWS